jgi:hypothetical protein
MLERSANDLETDVTYLRSLRELEQQCCKVKEHASCSNAFERKGNYSQARNQIH